MKLLGQRSIFLRLFFGIMSAMLIIWIGFLSWDIYRVDYYKKYYALEIKSWTQEITVAMEVASSTPQNMRSTAQEMEALRSGWFKKYDTVAPRWQLQVWKGQTLIYASSDPRLSAPRRSYGAPGSAPLLPADASWISWVEISPDYNLTVRIDEEAPIFGWRFTPQHMWHHLSPLLFSFPFLLLPAWLIIGVGLRPLRAIVREIGQRCAADLSPLPSTPYRELSPLVESINRLMARLTERLQREKEFLIDAAHELKTPLAVIQVNAGSLVESRDPARLHQARRGLIQGVARTAHTVYQLLALARSDTDRGHALLQPIDMVQLVRDRLVPAMQVALQRDIAVELQAPHALELPLHRESMVSMIDNLINNAIKYSPERASVKVSIAVNDDHAHLTITDQGPGIPPLLRKKVFERFYRIPGQEQEGSGLGLAIVEKAAELNHASIHLDSPANQNGLIVVVRFPLNKVEPQFVRTVAILHLSCPV